MEISEKTKFCDPDDEERSKLLKILEQIIPKLKYLEEYLIPEYVLSWIVEFAFYLPCL